VYLNSTRPLGLGHTASRSDIATGTCGNVISSPFKLTVLSPGSGDGDGNGSTNGLDMQGFIDAMLSGSITSCAHDMNANGTVESGDVSLCVATLIGGYTRRRLNLRASADHDRDSRAALAVCGE
jgi:hypothetical protein